MEREMNLRTQQAQGDAERQRMQYQGEMERAQYAASPKRDSENNDRFSTHRQAGRLAKKFKAARAQGKNDRQSTVAEQRLTEARSGAQERDRINAQRQGR